MTKMLQGWMVVPALAATYLYAGTPRLAVRLRQLALAGVVMVAVSRRVAARRVAVAGLRALHRRLDRRLGVGPDPRLQRLRADLRRGRRHGRRRRELRRRCRGCGGCSTPRSAAQIAWLLPLAAVSLPAGLWLTRGRARTDVARAGWILFGVWAIVHAVVFSFAKGTFHPYYVSALIPAVAALCGGGLVALIGWAQRSAAGMAALAVGVVGSALEAVALLGGLRAARADGDPGRRRGRAGRAAGCPSRTWRRVGAVAAVVAVLAGPATYSFATVGRSLNGDNVTGGPVSASFGRGGFGGSGSTDTQLVDYLVAHQGGAKYLVAANGTAEHGVDHHRHRQAGGHDRRLHRLAIRRRPSPSSRRWSRAAQLKYVLLGEGGGRGGPGGGSNDIATWVKAHGKAVSGVSTSGGTLYAVSA